MTIFEEAEQIVNGARQEQYGSAERSLDRIGQMWGAILGAVVDGRQVALCMAALKLARESHQPKRDNLVDACGYLRLAELRETREDPLIVGVSSTSEE